MNRLRSAALLFSATLLVATGGARTRLQGASGQDASPPATPAVSPTPPADDDHDGISDALEQQLAETYAPVIYIEPDESNYPVNVDWFLARARLQYNEDCFPDVNDDIGPNPIGRQLLGPDAQSLWADGPNCGEGDTGYGNPPHRQLTTIATDPDGPFSAGPDTTGYSDQQTFVLADLDDRFRVGSTDPRDWKTYFHAYPAIDGGIMIQYWHVFAYNEFGGGFDNHGGDWDASIQVWLRPDLTLKGVWFSRHGDDHPGTFFCATIDADCSSIQIRLFGSTHPVMTIDGGGHAAFRSPEDWATCHCRVGEDITGPIGTIVWTQDTDAFDDPAALRKAEFVCDTNNICHLTLSAPSGGIVWKTWSAGNVVASGSLTNPITSPSAHGGLVNLGEYNPCTAATCLGTLQMSLMNAGEFHPLNDAFWLRYEGRWGSVGLINSGPRGPVFQGFEDRGESFDSPYRAWYNNGANAPASDASPWRVPPTTTAALQGNSFTGGGLTFISGTTLVALSATESPIASQYGPVTTFYRYHAAGSPAPPFAQYAGPFPIVPLFAPPDGTYIVDYFSVDGLGNVEAVKVLSLVLDTTAPVASIVQPAATTYLHSSTLTLNYSVSDGAGSGVANFTPKMDGASTLKDGTGLASGQAINLLTALSTGPHTLSINATDHLANQGTSSVTFTVVVTADSIKQDVLQFLAAHKIRNAGIATALIAKLDVAGTLRSFGQCGIADILYNTFITDLRVLSGKGVDPDAAAVMIGDAQYLIAHCP